MWFVSFFSLKNKKNKVTIMSQVNSHIVFLRNLTCTNIQFALTSVFLKSSLWNSSYGMFSSLDEVLTWLRLNSKFLFLKHPPSASRLMQLQHSWLQRNMNYRESRTIFIILFKTP